MENRIGLPPDLKSKVKVVNNHGSDQWVANPLFKKENFVRSNLIFGHSADGVLSAGAWLDNRV